MILVLDGSRTGQWKLNLAWPSLFGFPYSNSLFKDVARAILYRLYLQQSFGITVALRGLLQGPQELPMLRSHNPVTVKVSYTSNIPQTGIGNIRIYVYTYMSVYSIFYFKHTSNW